MPIPNETIWVSWQDRHGPGLKALTTNQQLNVDRKYKLVTCKHSSSATATTQACDVGTQFRTIKTLVKSTTEEILSNVGIKGLFIEQLNKLKEDNILDLNLKDRKALIDHVSTMGDIV